MTFELVRYARAILQRIFPPRSTSLSDRYPKYRIGRGTYGDLSVFSWGEGKTLEIGNFTSIAAGVKIFLGGEHRTDWVTTFPFNVLWHSAQGHTGHPKSRGDVVIGNDVWIGTEALIMSGVTVGDGAVIGARAVVRCDVPPYAVAIGNPAQVKNFRFDQGVVKRLLALKWWNWSDLEIQRAMPELLNCDILHFLSKAERGDYCDEHSKWT
jgi:chloramphenicol O-acetyltransferase type B